jgi:hypothetical protein
MEVQNEIVTSSFIKGEDNIHCDKMSRGIRPRALGYSKEVCWNAHRDKEFVELVKLVDPRVENMEEGTLTTLWGQLKRCLGIEFELTPPESTSGSRPIFRLLIY